MPDTIKPRTTLKVLLTALGLVAGLAIGKIAFSPKAPENSASEQAHGLRTGLEQYAPKHFSERNEETIIRHFFKDHKGGVFLDVGAYHYRDGSNTYYLEKYLNWKGIAIDANGEFAGGYHKNRPQTKFFSFFVSDTSDAEADFYVVRDPGHLTKSTAVPEFVKGRKTEEVKVPTITLNDLLGKLGVQKIDFLNIDIELWEAHALAGFDIEKYRPDLVCIEAHRQVRDQLLTYFGAHGYVRLDQYFLFDQRNWYFTPKDRYKEMSDVSY